MDRRGLLVWLLLLVLCTHAAFIQRLPCSLEEEASINPLFEPLSLSGSLDNDGDTTSLSVRLLGGFLDDRCEELNGESAALMLDARVLGNSVADGKPWRLNGTCPSLLSKTNPRYDPRTYAIYEAAFPLDCLLRFSTLDTTLQLYLNDTEFACIRTHITPYIGSIASKAIMGFPLAIMLLSGIVIGGLNTYQKRRRSRFRYELEDDLLRDPAESMMPGISPCLHYIQFIFLTGCLTLSYPGFFRAIVSNLSWSSLIFENWPVTHQFTYPGVEDGIYSFNATFGLEEMAQYLGSTTTSDVWTNSIVNLALLIFGVVIFIQLGSFYNWLKQVCTLQDPSLPNAENYLQAHFPTVLRRTGWSVARLVLDYFLLPLLCFSLFQMNNAQWFSIYHTSLALVAVALLAGALVLITFRLAKTGRQSVFFHQQDFLPGAIGQHWVFYTLYGVPIIKGIAIGGLQLSGLAQVILLAGCEIWILASGLWNWRAGLFTWRPALLASARLAALLMSFAFVPEVGATDRTRGIIAYCILSLHLFVLVGGFVIDCIYEPLRYTLYKHGVLESAPQGLNHTRKAPVFGIAQLSHRPERRFSFAHLSALDPAGPFTPHTRKSSSRRPGSSVRPDSSEKSFSLSDAEPPPLRSRENAQTSFSSSKDAAESSPVHSSCSRQRQCSGEDSGSSSENAGAIELASLETFTEITHSSEYYAQRESDQFYRHCHREQPSPPSTRLDQQMTISTESSSDARPQKLWWPWKNGRQTRKESGFEVFRPAATPRSGGPVGRGEEQKRSLSESPKS